MYKILDKINSPRDLKPLSKRALTTLCDEIRDALIKKLSITGGHIGSNLAIVETSVALHYVFNSPIDKIVFDVSHQCYTHKILTGRKDAYLDSTKYSSVGGFTNPLESEHDIFSIGHTSTSVSLACGLAKARDLKGEKYNVVAVIGDGSLSGGEAYEGLNNASMLSSNFIIVVNDNQMSIAENHGGLYNNLELLRRTKGNSQCNFFKSLGFDYRFVENGNDLEELINVLSEVKDINHPVVLHVCTIKGKGYKYAEADKENWHFKSSFDIETGQVSPRPINETYETLTRDYLVHKMSQDANVVAVTAGTPKVMCFDASTRAQFPKQFIDVGIAEEHAVATVSGIAKNGGKPVFGVGSSFIQRTYDQLSQDLALNKSPAVVLVFNSGISNGSQTHMGVFDLALTRSIPNILCMSPTCKEEYLSMLDWSIEQTEVPVIIRVPSGVTVSRKNATLNVSYNLPAKYEVYERGKDIVIIALGSYFELAISLCHYLKDKYKIVPTLINPRYSNVLDKKTLTKLQKDHKIVVTLENGVINGGFGEMISSFYGTSPLRVLNYGADREFVDSKPLETQLEKYHLTVEQMANDIKEQLNEIDKENKIKK